MPAILANRLLPLAVMLLLQPAIADDAIYGYVDQQGIERYTNIPDNKQYRLLFIDRLVVARKALSTPRGIFALPVEQRPFHTAIADASQRTGVDAALLHAVISVESGYRPDALSPRGATGLMQLLPATARRFGVADASDPVSNIEAGARYLKTLLSLFDNNTELALAAYNAGEQAVLRFGRRIPPYGETRRYVPLVMAHYARLSASATHRSR